MRLHSLVLSLPMWELHAQQSGSFVRKHHFRDCTHFCEHYSLYRSIAQEIASIAYKYYGIQCETSSKWRASSGVKKLLN